MDEFMTVAEAAREARVSISTIRARIRDETIPHTRRAGSNRVWIRETDLRRWMAGIAEP